MITYFSSRIGRKILSISILISIISIATISILSIIQLREVFIQKSVGDFEKIAGELYYNINRLIIKGKTDINIVTRNPVVISEKSTAAEKLRELQNLQDTFKIYEDITIIDTSGIVITSTHYSYRGDWRYKKHFMECKKTGKTIVSNVQAIRSPEKYIIDFMSPVFNQKGEITAVVAAQFDMKNMSDIITHVEIDRTGHAFLLNNSGKIISHRNRDMLFLKPSPALVDQIRTLAASLTFTASDGKVYAGSYFDGTKLHAAGNNIDWTVVILQQEDEMLSPLIDIIWRIALYSLIIGSIVVVLAILFSRTITGPIQQLTEGAAILGEGDLHHRVKIQTSDELEQLATSFNLMAENLYDSRERLKQRENTIRESEAKLRRIIENLGREYFLYTLDPNGVITFVSPSVKDMLGYTPDAFMTHFSTYWTENPINAEAERITNDCIAGGRQSSPYEIEILNRSGKPRALEMSGTPVFDQSGNVLAVEGIARDISERKKAAEEKRKALEFAAEQNKHAFIGQVAAKMAHDFNNVLMAIMGNSQLAILKCSDTDTRQRLERILDFAVRGRDITYNLLSFAKDQEPKQSHFKLEDKIDLVLSIFEKELKATEIKKDFEEGLPQLLADPGMIQDVLVNLVQNSIHAMSKTDNPRLSLKAYHLDDKIYFDIQDNGCGIPRAHQESIFTPSFTLKGSHDKINAYDAGIKGTGYGMSNIKKYIVEKHKGTIVIESAQGQGCKITIGLPVIKDRLSQEEEKEMAETKVYPNRRILLIEDETAIADVQYQILTAPPFNHSVSVAVNGQMAIETFDRNQFDVVSLDYMLPGKINGLDVYHHIRSRNMDIPVLFISGNIEFLESMSAIKAKDPHVEHVSKPIDNFQYVNEINALIKKTA